MTVSQLLLLIIICNMITIYEMFKTYCEIEDLKNEIEKMKGDLNNDK